MALLSDGEGDLAANVRNFEKFRPKKLRKNGVFDSKQSYILKKVDHNIGI
jgi:hypothetical protein